jgi:uncharacterized membrane protein (DUF373 family)
MEDKAQGTRDRYVQGFNSLFGVLDDIILVIVAFAIIALAAILLYEAASDFFFLSAHSIPHITSELMFVLIIMELFRQVLRQLNRHQFSLNPFLFIGFIASIRGILLSQMGLSMGELKWEEGVTQLIVHALIVLILVTSYYFYAKVETNREQKK